MKTQEREFLEQTFARYHHPDYLGSDPLEFVHRFTDPKDQEIVAVIAALLAYGNVKQIRKSIEAVLSRIFQAGMTPYQFVLAQDAATARVGSSFNMRIFALIISLHYSQDARSGDMWRPNCASDLNFSGARSSVGKLGGGDSCFGFTTVAVQDFIVALGRKKRYALLR